MKNIIRSDKPSGPKPEFKFWIVGLFSVVVFLICCRIYSRNMVERINLYWRGQENQDTSELEIFHERKIKPLYSEKPLLTSILFDYTCCTRIFTKTVFYLYRLKRLKGFQMKERRNFYIIGKIKQNYRFRKR